MFGTIFTYICKNANAKVELYSPTSVLSMGTRIKNPMSLKIALGYNYRNWHFTINAKNPFMNNKTTIEYIGTGIIRIHTNIAHVFLRICLL